MPLYGWVYRNDCSKFELCLVYAEDIPWKRNMDHSISHSDSANATFFLFDLWLPMSRWAVGLPVWNLKSSRTTLLPSVEQWQLQKQQRFVWFIPLCDADTLEMITHRNVSLFSLFQLQKKESGFPVSPYLLGFILFVVLGSSFFELLKNVGGKK